jgi:aryl-alcohol dehydrogenase-like predicted oxidoreductase
MTKLAVPLRAPDGTPASRLCFGTMQFGGAAASEADSAAMYAACREAGVNFFDTAHVYTGGDSERILGRLVAGERERLVIATKAGHNAGARGDTIRAEFDESRRRLGLDAVDILYMHRFDPATPLDHTLGALAGLREKGWVRHVGVSNYAAWQIMKADWIAREWGFTIDVVQPMLSLVKRQAEVEILPLCAAEGIACAPYSPLGGGLLTGKYARGEGGRLADNAMYRDRYAPGWMHEAAARLPEIAAEAGAHPATLAVAWAMARPGVTAPIVSARRPDQLGPSLAAADYVLDPALESRLSALTPAPPPATDRLEEA